MVSTAAANGASAPTIDQEALEVAARAISEAIGNTGIPQQITLSNGVVLRIKKIPRDIIKSAGDKHPEPSVPKAYIEDDDRWEDNPNDPDYIAALQRRAQVLAKALEDICLGLGTEIVSVPEGMQRPEDDGWIEDLSIFEITVPREPAKARYMGWLRFHALACDEDFGLATGLPLLMSAIGQEEVIRAMRSFRSGAGGDADSGLPAFEGGAYGSDVQQPDARAGAGD